MICPNCGGHTNKTTKEGCFHEHDTYKCINCGHVEKDSNLKRKTRRNVSYD